MTTWIKEYKVNITWNLAEIVLLSKANNFLLSKKYYKLRIVRKINSEPKKIMVSKLTKWITFLFKIHYCFLVSFFISFYGGCFNLTFYLFT